MTAYLDACPVNSDDIHKRFGSKECAEAVMEEKSISVSDVNTCLNDAGRLEEKLMWQKRNRAWSKYAVRINGWRFAGTIEPEGITRAICAAYIKPVPECDALVQPHQSLGVASMSGGMTVSNFLFVLFVIVSGLAFGMYIYKKFFFQRYIQKALREEVMLEVQSQLADYIPLEEMGNNSSSRFKL